jgi:hypothetical protein
MKRNAVVFFSTLFVLGLAAQSRADSYDFSTMVFLDGQDVEGMTLGVATFTSETGLLTYTVHCGFGIATAPSSEEDGANR